MLQYNKINLLILIIITLLNICYSFHIINNNNIINKRFKTSLTTMIIDAMRDVLGLIPLCDTNPFASAPPSIRNVVEDPTAGMTPEEITDYISNVGGGLCGLPEFVRTGVGLGLNLSLLAFGVLTVLYVLIGGINFTLENQLNDVIKDYEKKSGSKFWTILNADKNKQQNTFSPAGYVPSEEALSLAPDRFKTIDGNSESDSAIGGLNRKEKRLKAQLAKDVEKEKKNRL